VLKMEWTRTALDGARLIELLRRQEELSG